MKRITRNTWSLFLMVVLVSIGLQSCASSSMQQEYYGEYSYSSGEADESNPLNPSRGQSGDFLESIVSVGTRRNAQTEAQIASMQYVQQSNVSAKMQETTLLAKNALNENSPKPKERVLAYSATLRMYAKTHFDSILTDITETAKRNTGYVLYSDAQTITIAVPSVMLDTTIRKISMLGQVHYKNIRGNDVTDSYLDLQTRITNAEKTLQRFLDLLAKATTVESAVTVEKEIDRVSSLIESYKSQLARMNQSITYSTITVTLSEKTTPGPLGYVFVGLYSAVKWLFVW